MQVGKTDAIGGFGQPGVIPVIQVSDTVSPVVWVRALGTVGRGDYVGGEHTCRITTPDHGEARKLEVRRFMGYTDGQVSDTVGRDAVDGHLNRPLAVIGSPVGDLTITPGGLRTGDWLQGGRQEEISVLDTGN